jgi:hypothetical protein
VLLVTLLDNVVVTILILDDELAGFDVLLGVVPSATRVGGREGNLDTGDNATSKDSVDGLVSEEGTSNQRGENN